MRFNGASRSSRKGDAGSARTPRRDACGDRLDPGLHQPIGKTRQLVGEGLKAPNSSDRPHEGPRPDPLDAPSCGLPKRSTRTRAPAPRARGPCEPERRAHHLAPVLRRVRRVCLCHRNTSLAQCRGVHGSGSTSRSGVPERAGIEERRPAGRSLPVSRRTRGGERRRRGGDAWRVERRSRPNLAPFRSRQRTSRGPLGDC